MRSERVVASDVSIGSSVMLDGSLARVNRRTREQDETVLIVKSRKNITQIRLGSNEEIEIFWN